jgi:hypothetical protein
MRHASYVSVNYKIVVQYCVSTHLFHDLHRSFLMSWHQIMEQAVSD